MKTIILSTFGESNYYIPDIMLGAGEYKEDKVTALKQCGKSHQFPMSERKINPVSA